MNFDNRHIMYFDCDQRGRRTRCKDGCGKKNSNKGFERPFLILSLTSWNTNINNDGMYAIPITSKQGNVYSITIGTDIVLDENIKNFKDSNILCDKICRISKGDLAPFKHGNLRKIQISEESFRRIKKKVQEALAQSGVIIS